MNAGSRAGWVEFAVLVTIALAVRFIFLDHAPYVDELNHAIAARSLLAEGTLQIGEGAEYLRARLFTYLVAGSIGVLGDTLPAGRIPAVLAGVGLIVAVAAWTNRLVGRWGAWTSGILLCFAPISIYLSQQVRFYTLQTLLLWIGAVTVFGWASSGRKGHWRNWLRVLLAAACFAVAFHLQPISAVGVAAIGLWLALDRGPSLVRWIRAGGKARGLLSAAVLLTAVATLAVLGAAAAPRVTRMFSYADLWAAASQNDVAYYHWRLAEQYPTLWTLLPIAFLIGASKRPRAAIFLTTVVALAFAFHSFAAWKSERYFFYALPFFFALWGLAAATAVPWAWTRFAEALARLDIRLPQRIFAGAFAVLMGVAILFAAAGNRATLYAYKMLTVTDAEWRISTAYRGEGNWEEAADRLRPMVETADVVVASSMLKAIYYFDRVDVGLTATELTRTPGGEEFSIVGKEAVPVISEPESLDLLVRCYANGLVVADERGWAAPWTVPQDAVEYITRHMEPVPLPTGLHVRAFRWENPSPASGAECDITRGRGASS